jgi:hypothetical protein
MPRQRIRESKPLVFQSLNFQVRAEAPQVQLVLPPEPFGGDCYGHFFDHSNPPSFMVPLEYLLWWASKKQNEQNFV